MAYQEALLADVSAAAIELVRLLGPREPKGRFDLIAHGGDHKTPRSDLVSQR
jgi:hypothetical protein